MRAPTRHPSAVVEILGPWVQNKGDDLMLRAVCERLQDRYTFAASSPLGMKDLSEWPSLRRVRWRSDYRRDFAEAVREGSVAKSLRVARNGLAMELLPVAALSARGAVPGRSITALLDCSGFAYGDQWTTRRLEARTAYYARLKRQGAALILLPQALGPFDRPEMRAAASALFAHFDLLYARDTLSHRHLVELGVDPARVHTVPDITHPLPGRPPPDPQAWRSRACIVPNARMLDKAAPEVGARYLDFLGTCIRRVRAGGLDPWIVLHETNDRPLIAEIESRAGGPLPVLDEDAVATKGILGACHLAISSRFHAIISCLSQGVPVLGTSWTHKYDALFDEYDCPGHLVSPLDREDAIAARLDGLIDPARRDATHRRLAAIAAQKKARVEAMWTEVEAKLSGVWKPDMGAFATETQKRRAF